MGTRPTRRSSGCTSIRSDTGTSPKVRRRSRSNRTGTPTPIARNSRETNLTRREIALAEAERRLAETEVFAEFAGVLSNVNVGEGGLVSDGLTAIEA